MPRGISDRTKPATNSIIVRITGTSRGKDFWVSLDEDTPLFEQQWAGSIRDLGKLINQLLGFAPISSPTP